MIVITITIIANFQLSWILKFFRPSSIAPSNKTVSDEKCFLCSIFKDSFDNVQDRVTTRILEGFGGMLGKEFNIGREPVSSVDEQEFGKHKMADSAIQGAVTSHFALRWKKFFHRNL